MPRSRRFNFVGSIDSSDGCSGAGGPPITVVSFYYIVVSVNEPRLVILLFGLFLLPLEVIFLEMVAEFFYFEEGLHFLLFTVDGVQVPPFDYFLLLFPATAVIEDVFTEFEFLRLIVDVDFFLLPVAVKFGDYFTPFFFRLSKSNSKSSNHNIQLESY